MAVAATALERRPASPVATVRVSEGLPVLDGQLSNRLAAAPAASVVAASTAEDQSHRWRLACCRLTTVTTEQRQEQKLLKGRACSRPLLHREASALTLGPMRQTSPPPCLSRLALASRCGCLGNPRKADPTRATACAGQPRCAPPARAMAVQVQLEAWAALLPAAAALQAAAARCRARLPSSAASLPHR